MFGVGGKLLLRIRDFLVDRTCVTIASDMSDPKAVSRGVPQGSVLSPVLVSI